MELPQPRDRASCVILRGEAVLLIRRQKPGETYYVFPGGAVEPGEQPLAAAYREMKEESGLEMALNYPLGEIVDERGTNTFFKFDIAKNAEPVWVEQEKRRPDNSYSFEWVPLSNVGTINLQPAEARQDILAQLDRGYSLDTIKAAHSHSSGHRKELEKSSLCGCFYCFSVYPPTDIKKWIDDGDCAVCPRCGIDSVIGDASGYPVEKSFLLAMYDYFF